MELNSILILIFVTRSSQILLTNRNRYDILKRTVYDLQYIHRKWETSEQSEENYFSGRC